MHTAISFKRKRIWDPPLVINWKEPIRSYVSSLHSKCFGAVSEQRMRNKKKAGSKRAGRGWSARKSGPLGSVGGRGASAPITPSLRACNYCKPPWQPALVGDHLPEAFTYPQHQHFSLQPYSWNLSQMTTSDPVTDHNHLWGWLLNYFPNIVFNLL